MHSRVLLFLVDLSERGKLLGSLVSGSNIYYKESQCLYSPMTKLGMAGLSP